MPCRRDPYWDQISELQRAMSTMRNVGIPINDPAYRKLWSVRGAIKGIPGDPFPRTWTQILKLIGLSPGELTLWHDIECGWVVEVRERPGSQPVYNAVPDEVAMDILQGRRVHEHSETYSREPVNVDQ